MQFHTKLIVLVFCNKKTGSLFFYRLPVFYYSIIQFVSSVDSLDWKNYGVDSIISTVLDHKALGNGSIILMHNGAKYTKDALPSVIEGLQKKGYEIVPISELIYKENYEMDTQGRQHPISATEHTTAPES